MEDSKLIKAIWRFNAFVIAIAGLLSIGILLFAGYEIVKNITREKNRTEIVNIDPETNIEEKLALGVMDRIPGSKSVMVPLYSEQKFDLQYSGKRASSIRNFMFSNIRKKESHWLLETNNYLILNHRQLREGNPYNNDKDIQVIAYEIVKSDTSDDKRLTNSDLLTVSLSSPEGKHYTEILSNVEYVIGYEVIDKATLAIMYRRDGQAFIGHISLKEFKITTEIELPKTKAKQ
jgi:hypothetical protein